MRYGIDEASVFLFDSLHLGIDFGFLVDPEAAEAFKEANFVAFAEALDIWLIDVQPFHKLDSLFFLGNVLVCHFRILLKCNFVKFRSCSRCS